jgi:hypothetical protein
MSFIGAHSHFGTYDAPNDEKQATIALVLTAVMAVVSVVLILATVLSPAA